MRPHAIMLISSVMLMTGCAQARLPIGESKQIWIQPLSMNQVDIKYEGELKNKNKAFLDSLCNELSTVNVYSFDNSGSLTYLPVAVSEEHKRYIVVIDYSKYKNHESQKAFIFDENNNKKEISVINRVGVSLRVTADITTNKAGLSIGSLSAIGASAQSNYLSGSMTIESIGITGKAVSPFLPFQADLSQSSIQQVIQIIGTIKAKMYDSEDITISPQIISVGVGRITIPYGYQIILQGGDAANEGNLK